MEAVTSCVLDGIFLIMQFALPFFFFFFLAVLGLRCFARALSSCVEQLWHVRSVVVARGL